MLTFVQTIAIKQWMNHDLKSPHYKVSIAAFARIVPIIALGPMRDLARQN